MFDFTKKLIKSSDKKITNPIEIYQGLDRKSDTGPLRRIQEEILKKWYEEKKNEEELIIKLHTGSGKTLIGLLILLSKINLDEGPCLYVCPNKYLVEQVRKEAKKFGISFCEISENNEIPMEFINGESILITYAHKVFNGKSIFGLSKSKIDIGTIILDDSHSCIETIANSFTINVPKESELYNELLSLFEEDLRKQGEGDYYDIKNNEYSKFMYIPYWAWDLKKEEVFKLLYKNRKQEWLQFTWDLLLNDIGKCRAFISSQKIEILPHYIPIHYYNFFHKAKNKILMSATTQNDSFFINGLGLSGETVKKPLNIEGVKWSGEKMILIPSVINKYCDNETVVSYIAKSEKKPYGIVVIVPSNKKQVSYSSYGAEIVNKNNIVDILENLKSKKFDKTIVLSNRYDGIDLPDESCRILLIDSLPYAVNISEKYEELCRRNSEIINRKITQKIEQGLGRSVRGEKDYSAILLIGNDLVKFIRQKNTNKLFSMETRKQIDIGLEIATDSQMELNETEPFKLTISLINQLLKRDEGWKSFYSMRMQEIKNDDSDDSIIEILTLEAEAEKNFYLEKYAEAIEKIDKLMLLINDEEEKGWYLEKKARYRNKMSKVESIRTQASAHSKNMNLLKPQGDITYKKIKKTDSNRINNIKKWISTYENYEELIVSVNEILDDLSFQRSADKFELSLDTIGKLLGFKTQRPDKMIGKGPDNLWHIEENEFIMFECKNEVKEDRKEIHKEEASQMNTHCVWFRSTYEDSNSKNFMIIPTKNLAFKANLDKSVEIITKLKLEKLKNNIRKFIKEFEDKKLKDVEDEELNKWLKIHDLDLNKLLNDYSNKPFHLKK